MKKFIAVSVFLLLLSGCSGSTISGFTDPNTGIHINLSDDGKTPKSEFTVSINGVFGYENTGYFSEVPPEKTDGYYAALEQHRYNVSDKAGGMELTDASSTFYFGDHDYGIAKDRTGGNLIHQSCSMSGEITLTGVYSRFPNVTEEEMFGFFPYPHSLKQSGLPTFPYTYWNEYNNIVPIKQPDGSEKYMDTMWFVLDTYAADTDVELDGNEPRELTVTFASLQFDTGSPAGITRALGVVKSIE